MKGKLAFILGAAVGYVLGTRAGRERYEQIKRGAQRVWRTEPVQRGVGLVKGAVDDRADELKAFAVRVGNDVFSNLMQKTTAKNGPQPSEAAEPEQAEPEPTEPEQTKQPRQTRAKSGSKSAGAKPASSSKRATKDKDES
jgi:hypothetical protein